MSETTARELVAHYRANPQAEFMPPDFDELSDAEKIEYLLYRVNRAHEVAAMALDCADRHIRTVSPMTPTNRIERAARAME